jgi:hypothetical protein
MCEDGVCRRGVLLGNGIERGRSYIIGVYVPRNRFVEDAFSLAFYLP